MAYQGIYVVVGPPGTGKTSAIARQVEKICNTVERPSEEASPVVVCSLTRAAAREAASRDLPIPDWQVGTLHSMAYRQIGAPPVAEAESKHFNDKYSDIAISADSDTDDSTGDILVENPNAPGNALYQAYSLYRARMLPRNEWRPDVLFFAECWEGWKQKNGLVDFGDMIDLAATEGKGYAPGNPSVIIVDEAQDISLQEYNLLRVWYEAAGALIVVGDPRQSLYCWRGADHSIFFDPAIAADHRKVLHQSYRVPRVVRNLAVQWLKEKLSNYTEVDYRARPEDGSLGVFNSTSDSPGEVIEYVKHIVNNTDETIMLAATCGYMLKKTISELRAAGIPFSNPWRRKRSDWNPLRPTGRGTATHFKLMGFYNFLVGKSSATFQDVHGLLDLFRVEGTLRRGVKSFYTTMAQEAGPHSVEMIDVQNAFEADAWAGMQAAIRSEKPEQRFCSWLQEHTSATKANVLAYVTEVVKNFGFKALLKEPRCFAGTMHSYKGAQADHVVLFPDLSQAGDRAFNSRSLMGSEDRDGVVRTFYVGMTRARKSLAVCRRKSNMSVDIPLDMI